uniref:Uncharacterized protein n=1 Tax=Anopheles dirus TaxID=7168 RepID=A0A182NW91_9DIPT
MFFVAESVVRGRFSFREVRAVRVKQNQVKIVLVPV